jgi:hypothetical protein
MILFAVSDSSSGVSVGSEVVEFCGSVVRALWHLTLSLVRIEFLVSAPLISLNAQCQQTDSSLSTLDILER